MEKFLFEDIEEFVDKFLEEYENRENEEDFLGVSIVAHYKPMIDILNYLLATTGLELHDIDLQEPESEYYYDEYILTVDKNAKIWCQKAKYNDTYIYLEKDVTFIHSDVNSKFIVKNKNEHMIEFDFGVEEECECYDFGTMCCCEECSKTANKSTSTSYTYDDNDGYTLRVKCNLDAEEALKVIEHIEKRMERVNDMFKEMNEFRKLFGW